jgi:hypothetical protein
MVPGTHRNRILLVDVFDVGFRFSFGSVFAYGIDGYTLLRRFDVLHSDVEHFFDVFSRRHNSSTKIFEMVFNSVFGEYFMMQDIAE